MCPSFLQMQPHIRVRDLAPEYNLDFSSYWAPQPDALVQCTNCTPAYSPHQRDWLRGCCSNPVRDANGMDQGGSRVDGVSSKEMLRKSLVLGPALALGRMKCYCFSNSSSKVYQTHVLRPIPSLNNYPQGMVGVVIGRVLSPWKEAIAPRNL